MGTGASSRGPLMTRACVTSSRVMMSLATVVTCGVVTVALLTSSVTSSTVSPSSSSGAADLLSRDEGVCRTRYVSTAEGSEDKAASRGTVGIAAVLELRRPQGQGCGQVYATELQTVAALYWAVGRLNGDHHPELGPYIPGLRLELRVYDDCSREVLAARHMGEILSSHPDFNCTPAFPLLAGVLGTTTSQTTSFVAGLLSRTSIPHFGTSATVSMLSDKVAFPTFFRTVPSDLTQSKVLVELVLHLKWTYVVGMHTRDNYGTEGFQEFKRLATKAGVCVFKEKAFSYSDQFVEDSLETFIRELLIEFGNTRFPSLGVIYFGQDTEAAILFRMIHDRRSRWHDQKVGQLYWLVSDGVGTSLTLADLVKPYTMLSISPATTTLTDINDHFFHAIDNPETLGPYWNTLVTQYLQEVHGCSQPSPVSRCQLRDKVETSDYLPAALDSFYSLAALIDTAHKEACGGGAGSGEAGSEGLCANMSVALRKGLLTLARPQALNYSHQFSAGRLPARFQQDRLLVPDQFGDLMPANSPLYFINAAVNGRWQKIGEYSNGSLTFALTSSSSASVDLGSIPRSECGTNCQRCRSSGAVRFAFIPGDVLLLGLYSVSSPAAPTSFSCGDYRKQSSSVAALLAFLHSVNSLTLDGQAAGGERERFGALVLDDCYNKLTASALITELFSGKTTLYDPMSGEPIDMTKVVAVVGSQSSSVTLSALSVLTPLHIPAISYSATSPDLDDRLTFPYFLRPVPSDSLQAQALVEVVQRLNVSYVGALHQNNNYGWRGMQTFLHLAQEAGICVETPVPVNDGDSEGDLLGTIRDIRNKDAMVVVVFLVEPSVLQLLDAIRGQNLDVIFLASEAWTLSTDTLHGQRGMTARGSLVLTVDTTREAGDVNMADYLQGLTTPGLAATSDLPWIRDFWENEKQCNLPGGFTNSHKDMCLSDSLSAEVVQELAEDQKVVQTINTVVSITTALQQHCGHQSDPAACMLSLTADQVTTLIRKVQLTDGSRQTFRPFLSNGNGNVGFTLHNVQKTDSGTYSYVEVGHFDPDRGLRLERDIVFYDQIGHPMTVPSSSSSCLYKLHCRSVCNQGQDTTPVPAVSTPSPSAGGGKGGDGGLVGAVVVLTLACALLMAVLATVVCCAKRRGRIPCLGVVVKKGGTPQGAASTRRRMSGIEARMSGGEVNFGFQPLSPRSSLPLPPVPRSRPDVSAHQYNVPSDLDGTLSLSSAASSSCLALGSPGTYRDDRPRYYSEDDDGDPHRRPQSRSHHRQSRRSQHHADLRRQLQEGHHPQGWGGGEQHRFPPSSSSLVGGGRERPRARSLAAERPHTLSVQGLRHLGDSLGAEGRSGAGDEGGTPLRPRAYSHDAAFRARLGALSEDDQLLLLRYLTTSRQQSLSPGTPQSSAASPVRHSLSPVTPSSSVVSPAVCPLPGGRPTFYLPQTQTPESRRGGSAAVASASVVLENRPPFNPSSGLVNRRALEEEGDSPALLYLHALPTEKDMYLQLLPDPVQQHSPPHTHPSSSHSFSPSSSSPSVPAVVKAAGGGAPPVPSPPVRGGVTWGPAARQTSPRTPAASSPPVCLTPSPQPAATSPPASVPGSTTSESSGAVFVSPHQEYPPAPFQFSASPRNVSPRAVSASATPPPSSLGSTSSGQLGSSPQRSSAALLSSPVQQQHPGRVWDTLQQAMGRDGSSPSFQQPMGREGASPSAFQQQGKAPSPRLDYSTPQTSPQGMGDFPGVFVRDRAGAIFWLPGVMVPPHSQGSRVASFTTPPTAAAQLSPMMVLSPQEVAGHVSPAQPLSPPLLADLPGALSPESSDHALTGSPTAYGQRTPGTSPTYRQPPVTLSPVQQTPATLTPTSRQQAPPPVIPTERSRAPRMGVDSLSVSKKQSEAVMDQNHNEDGTHLRTPASESVGSFPQLGGESTSDSSPKEAPSAWGELTDEHPGSPQRTRGAEPAGWASLPPPRGDRPAVHDEERVSPGPAPSPCRPLDHPQVSGGSGGSTGDSGTGEDLMADTDNVNAGTEISV